MRGPSWDASPTLALSCCAVVLAVLASFAPAPASASVPIEDYAGYEPATRCSPGPKPGTLALSRWMVTKFGSHASISRSCRKRQRVSSEHQEGRAIDWTASAATAEGRAKAQALLDSLFATDGGGNPHAKARRMGVMYVIWNDHMYAAWNRFEPEPYLSSSCRTRKRCSATLRHRDHVHVSLTRAGAQARTSWFLERSAAGEG